MARAVLLEETTKPGLENRVRLKVLNDTKLIPIDF